MIAFEIRKGLPMPSLERKPPAEIPFETLQVGDCVVVSTESRSAVYMQIKKFTVMHPGWKFESRKIPDSNDCGFWVMKRPGSVALSKPKAFILRANEQIHDVLEVERDGANATGARLRELAKFTPTGKRTVSRR